MKDDKDLTFVSYLRRRLTTSQERSLALDVAIQAMSELEYEVCALLRLRMGIQEYLLFNQKKPQNLYNKLLRVIE